MPLTNFRKGEVENSANKGNALSNEVIIGLRRLVFHRRIFRHGNYYVRLKISNFVLGLNNFSLIFCCGHI